MTGITKLNKMYLDVLYKKQDVKSDIVKYGIIEQLKEYVGGSK
jgi:hypothetical protein